MREKSNGGTFGFLFASTTSAVERAVLVVGGGGLVHFLQRATQWNDYGPLIRVRSDSSADNQLYMAMMQQVIDPIDSINYVSHLTEPRFEGLGPMKAQLHMAVHDSQVNNLITEWVARSAGVPLVTPSPKEIWGLAEVERNTSGEIPLSVKSALHVFDEDVTPNPITNTPPAEDNRTHNTVRDLEGYKQSVIRFLDEGRFVHACEGPCDPN